MRTEIDFTMPHISKPEFVYSNIDFNDLTWEAQQKVINAVKEYIEGNNIEVERWVCCDKEGDVIPEDTEEKLYLFATKLAQSSWVEWGVDVKHKGVK